MDDMPPDARRRSDWAGLADLATTQGGCVTHWQAGRLGISSSQLARRQADEGWGAPMRSVATLPGVPPSRTTELWAALLAVADIRAPRSASGSSVESLRLAIADLVCVAAWSAAQVRGYPGASPGIPQLLAPHSVTTERHGIRLVRSRRGIGGFWEWVDGLPVARPLRSLWDAAHLGRGLSGAARKVADLAVFFDRTRQLSIQSLLLAVDEPAVAGYPATPPPIHASAAELVRPGYSHSQTEAVARRIATEVATDLGVRLHPSPYGIRDRSGLVVAEADIAAPALRFDAEVDGPHHRGPLAEAYHRRRATRTDPLDWIVCRYAVDEATDQLDEERFRSQFTRDLRRAMALRHEGASG